MKKHHYTSHIRWDGNLGQGTAHYRAYERTHTIAVAGKPDIPASSDPAFRGDPTRYNPEELLVASLSSCHMLWFLHLCSEAGVVVVDYQDAATGTMTERPDGSGAFEAVVLHPKVVVQAAEMIEKVPALHHRAHEMCFIANSCNFLVACEGECWVAE